MIYVNTKAVALAKGSYTLVTAGDLYQNLKNEKNVAVNMNTHCLYSNENYALVCHVPPNTHKKNRLNGDAAYGDAVNLSLPHAIRKKFNHEKIDHQAFAAGVFLMLGCYTNTSQNRVKITVPERRIPQLYPSLQYVHKTSEHYNKAKLVITCYTDEITEINPLHIPILKKQDKFIPEKIFLNTNLNSAKMKSFYAGIISAKATKTGKTLAVKLNSPTLAAQLQIALAAYSVKSRIIKLKTKKNFVIRGQHYVAKNNTLKLLIDSKNTQKLVHVLPIKLHNIPEIEHWIKLAPEQVKLIKSTATPTNTLPCVPVNLSDVHFVLSCWKPAAPFNPIYVEE